MAVPIEVVEQGGEDLGPGAILAPAPEAVVDGLPRAIAWRDVTPRGTGVQTPEEAVDQAAMRFPRMATTALMAQVWEEPLDAVPLRMVQFVAVHGKAPFGNLPAGQLESLLL